MAGATAVAVASTVLLAACTADPTPSPAPTETVTATPTATPTPEPQSAAEATTVEQALPFFTDVVADVAGTEAQYQGRAYIDALVAAGFDKSAMEVTEDETAIGLQADNIQFAVRWGDECLVGQIGPTIPDPVIAVLPLLDTGLCLIGHTRPIDW